MYTLWYYVIDRGGRWRQAYDVMSGSRSACYRRRAELGFSHQYKVIRNR